MEDVDPKTLDSYKEHEFDKHPVMTHYKVPGKHQTEDMVSNYIKARSDYQDSHHMDSYHDRHDALEEADPEGYAQRGSKSSDPVHHGHETFKLPLKGLPEQDTTAPAAKPAKTDESPDAAIAAIRGGKK